VVAEWIMQLAVKAGTALIGAAVTDAWQSARTGVVRLFGRAGSRRQEVAEAWLDEDAAALDRANPAERDDLRSLLVRVWRQRLADLLAEFPDAREELEALVDQMQSNLPAAQQSWMQTNIAGRDAYVVQRGNQYVYGVSESASDTKSGCAGRR